MRRFATFVAIFLLLAGAAPLLACVAEGAASHEQSACCRAMHGQCGDMAKTGCCRMEIKSDQQPQAAATSPTTHPPSLLFVRVQLFGDPSPQAHTHGFPAPDQHSPPGLILARTANLRI